MYVKGLFEVFKILGRLGIKPKDVIGLSGDVVKMGKSLFNTRVNPKLLEFIAKKQKIPTKIIEEIKIHARTLKNASENQKKLFEVNIREILKAKTPPKIQTTRGMGDLWPRQLQKIKEKVNKEFALKRFKEAAEKSQSPVTGVQKPVTSVKEQGLEAFKGWKPIVIKGGKDGLATGGRAGFDSGGSALQKLQQEIVNSMKPYAPGVSEDRLWIIVKDINLDMTAEQAQASAKSNFIKLFGMAEGGLAGMLGE